VSEPARAMRKPDWMRKKISLVQTAEIRKGLREKGLHTVCESARCPNIGECFGRKRATLMILGDVCTRNCGFCNIDGGRPGRPDSSEPENVARMVKELGLAHAVITSVTRDDLPDGGAEHFARTVRAVRKSNPGTAIELLIPDFGGDRYALETVLLEKPDILNHNIETVPSLYSTVRPQADFERSLELLRRAASFNLAVKSGIMIGFGETEREFLETMERLHESGVKIVTVGQYLQPSKRHLPVVKYFPADWFEDIARKIRAIGIPKVFAGPFVRSSYMADKVAAL